MFLVAASQTALADYVWETFGDNQYTLTQEYGTFQQCENEAVLAGGHLVTINSSAENDWLASTYPTHVWIGLYGNLNTWAWSSSEPVLFTSWDVAYGQPDGWSSAEGALLNLYTPGKWHDVPTSGWGDPSRGIIEVSTPEPSTIVLLGIAAASLFAYAWRRRQAA
jgi:hypothetical protein